MNAIELYGLIYPIDNSNERGVMTTQIKLKDLLKIYKVNKNVNRDVSYNRLPRITKYINSYDAEPGIFFPAIVCAYSGNPIQDFDKEASKLTIPIDNCLVVIDGQHRIKALENYISNNYIPDYKKHEVLNTDFTLQLYFGLNEEDMRNLFADINSNSVKVSMSLITAYDNRDILNVLTKEIYEISTDLQILGVEFEKSKIVKPTNSNFITSARLKKFISLILFGKKLLNNTEEKILKENYDQILSFLERLFYLLCDSFPKDPENIFKHVLCHEAVQNSLALILHLKIFNNKELYAAMNWEEFMEIGSIIDWSITNDLWKKFLIKVRIGTQNEHYSIEAKDEKKIYNLLLQTYGDLV